ncbi:MAG: EAL domain-containing protein [Gammaproteobacteria bacterium]|nr:EAL domain-containing protein [Gammaproteobacteria bacterium]
MNKTSWYLEGFFSGRTLVSRLAINRFPFQIGRDENVDFSVPSDRVSRIHAEIDDQSGDINSLVLRDLNSTNGTYINHKKLTGETPVQHGDVIHFGNFEVRLIRESAEETRDSFLDKTTAGIDRLSIQLPTGVRELQELLNDKTVVPAFQPIVCSNTESIHAYEVLGRGTHSSLDKNPVPLFRIAESIEGLANALSVVFRDAGIARAATFETSAKFFINLHPDELKDTQALVIQMEEIRQRYPDLALVLEIHEQSAPDLDSIISLKQELDRLGIELAYDDFGSGQARLLELVEAPAQYLKFDVAMVQNIHSAPEARRDMIQMLVELARKMGMQTIAEGIENIEDVQVCKALGFDYIQGFYYAPPTEDGIQTDIDSNQ